MTEAPEGSPGAGSSLHMRGDSFSIGAEPA